MATTLRVLFLSRRNTVRSLMAEAIMNRNSRGRFEATSAGVETAAAADPLAMRALELARYDTAPLRPKTVGEVLTAGAPAFDFISTLSDTARGEPLPEVSGQPVTAHWACDDPVLLDSDEVGKALIYGRVLAQMERRIGLFMDLPFERLDRMSLQHAVRQIDGAGETV